MFSMLRRPLVTLATILFFVIPVAQIFGYALLGSAWPPGTTILMHLRLGVSPVPLSDGTGTWAGSAADALALWNAQLTTVRFAWVDDGYTFSTTSDGRNDVRFGNAVFGDIFGNDTLAVTVYFHNANNEMTEGDVIFNENLFYQYDSYRGPLRGSPSSGYIYDFHRVALHEFGHVLGLDHPDENGQTVTAIMNSTISDLDHLANDDIAGGQTCFSELRISTFTGSWLQLHLPVGNFPPSSYSASGLPPTVTLNTATGLLTGAPTISGNYPFQVTVFSSTRNVSYTVRLLATPLPRQTGQLLGSLPKSVDRFAADPKRSRMYATSSSNNSVLVIDTDTLQIIKELNVGPAPIGLAISADGTTLWVATTGTHSLAVVSLDDLTIKQKIPLPFAPYQVVEGLHNLLYVTTVSDPNGTPVPGVMQINPATGAYQAHVDFSADCSVAVTPDRRSLFLMGSYLIAYDISADAFQLKQEGSGGDYGFYPSKLEVNNAGSFLALPGATGNSGITYSSSEVSTSDINIFSGSYHTGPYCGPLAFSADDSVLFEDVIVGNKVDLFDIMTSQLRTSISVLGDANDVLLDYSGTELFVSHTATDYVPGVEIFTTGLPARRPIPVPKSLANVSTRIEIGTNDKVGIGGFIVKGAQPKRIVMRALGPSLSQFGVLEPLAKLRLELYDGNHAVLATNENWNYHRNGIIATGYPPLDERECAIVATLPPGNYTAILRGLESTIGTALFELYDLDPPNSKIANISTRGNVGTGDNVMIGGFIVGEDQRTKVIVRALGPTLTDFGVTGALADPTLELHNGNGAVIAQNDNWKSTQQAAIQNSGYAPPRDSEAAILATLQPGNYTAIVRGNNNTTGIALVEVYNLDAN